MPAAAESGRFRHKAAAETPDLGPSALPAPPLVDQAVAAAAKTDHPAGIHAPSAPAPKSCSRLHQLADPPASAGSDPDCCGTGNRRACRSPRGRSEGNRAVCFVAVLMDANPLPSAQSPPPPPPAGMSRGSWRLLDQRRTVFVRFLTVTALTATKNDAFAADQAGLFIKISSLFAKCYHHAAAGGCTNPQKRQPVSRLLLCC